MPNGSDATHRTDRGRTTNGTPTFTDEQRVWLLERDLDEQDKQFEAFRAEVRVEFTEMKGMVSTRLWWLTGIGFSVLVAILGVLVAVIANRP